MNAKSLFYNTLIISIVVQIVTGIIGLGTFFIKIPTEYLLIKELLILELIVQVIEGAWYFWLAYNVTKILNITPKRYMDWVITTTTMLVTLILYLIFLDKKGGAERLDFFTLLKENSNIIIPVIILNWLMLLFGYLGEIKIIPVLLSVFLGFIPFLIYYYMIYVNYVTENTYGYLFFCIFSFFGHYMELWRVYPIIQKMHFITY